MPKPQATNVRDKIRQGATPASLVDDIGLLEWEKEWIAREPTPEAGRVAVQMLLDLRLFHKNFHYMLKKQGTTLHFYKKWMRSVFPSYGTRHTKRPYVSTRAPLHSLEFMAAFVAEPVGKMLYIDYEQYGI